MTPYELDLASTGNLAVDALQELQVEAFRLLDDDERKAFICRQIGAVPCEELIDRHLSVVSKGFAFANDPEQGHMTKHRFADLSFHGVAASLNYEKYHAVEMETVKGIMVSFVFPTITTGVPAEKVKDCYDLALRLPVLAIKSCTNPMRIQDARQHLQK